MGVIVSLIYLAIMVVMIVGMWKVFVKAGEPGWACLIPIYNIIVMLKIIGKPAWWFILMLIPIVNFVIAIILTFRMAKVFGQGTGFGFGMLFLPFVFYPMLGFGSATYLGPNV